MTIGDASVSHPEYSDVHHARADNTEAFINRTSRLGPELFHSSDDCLKLRQRLLNLAAVVLHVRKRGTDEHRNTLFCLAKSCHRTAISYLEPASGRLPHRISPEGSHHGSPVKYGRGGEIRTHDPLRPRQVRYQAALRPDICWLIHSKTLSSFFQTCHLLLSLSLRPNCIETVLKPPQFGLTVSKLLLFSLACRLSFSRASRFICNFICEYFLNTLASPWRSNWVTHSSATPPAESPVAHVERRSQIRKCGTPARRCVLRRLKRLLMARWARAARKQPRPRTRQLNLVLECLKRHIGERHFGDSIFCLGIRNPDRCVHQVNLVLAHRRQFL